VFEAVRVWVAEPDSVAVDVSVPVRLGVNVSLSERV